MAEGGDSASGEDGSVTRGGGSSGEEYETTTAAEVLASLEEAWINEKFAPELLEHKTEIVDCMLEQVKEMEQNLTLLRKGDFVGGVHKLELDRIRFVLCNYLRTRLQKIEKYVVHLLEQEGSRDPATPSRMCPEELVYAKEFADSLDAHLHSLVLKDMPSNFMKIDRKKAIQRPSLDRYVFIRATKETKQVLIDPEDVGDIVDFDLGSQYILRYRSVFPLVHSGAVKLV